MAKEPSFVQNVRILVQEIQSKGLLSVGQACYLLNRTPWTIERYGEAIAELHPEIEFNKRTGFRRKE